MRALVRIAIYTTIIAAIAWLATGLVHRTNAGSPPQCASSGTNTQDCEVDLGVNGALTFTPSTFAVQQGVTVTFKNVSTFTPHTSTSDPGDTGDSWDSGTLSPGLSFPHTFNTTGTFPFYCQFHGNLTTTPPSGMVGTVTVVGPPVTDQVAIAQGWNQIDVPLNNTGLSSISALIANINASLGGSPVTAGATYHAGAFSLYAPGFSRDIPLAAYDGIFVLSAARGTWTLTANAYQSGVTVPLTRGWNLVAAPYPTSGLLASKIATQIGSSVQEIALYNAGSSPPGYNVYTPGGSNDFQVAHTNGVWILTTAAGNWTPS